MRASRGFYVVQGELRIRSFGCTTFDNTLRFSDSDEGLAAFDDYLAGSDSEPSLIVVDVIEEVFSVDRVPRLTRGDRNDLLQRRLHRKYPRTPYRLANGAAGSWFGKDDTPAVYSSISNHELLDPWLARMMRHRVPLLGIYSVPLLTPQVFRRLYRSADPVLYVTQHQGEKLRQTFVRDGLVQSARLSQSPPVDDAAYAAFVSNEIGRSRRYLDRTRLLSSFEPIDVCMITDAPTAERIVEVASFDTPVRFHFVDPQRAKRRLHVVADTPTDQLQELYLASAMRERPRQSYAVSGEDGYWQMSRARRAIIGVACATAVTCAAIAGGYFGDALRLQAESAEMEAQVRQLSETFRRENDHGANIKADSYEMKTAVDTGEYILQQRVPVPWVMQQLGIVLERYPDVRVARLSWQAKASYADPEPRARPGEAPRPVPIPATDAVVAEITAAIHPFEGSLRDAFARIDALVADIKALTSFSEVAVTEYPIDASVHASVTGEIGSSPADDGAQFRLRLEYPLSASEPGGAR